ncbi:UNVERIFIED_CONTAM: hypothetical protein PYX00_003903 [Menopon gallinae]|uniref:Elongator complex protein 5 n=1 Tax=Menopon gallinae TaxID=328185 RepID=A0AAW2I3D6_9NEOP
MLKNFVNSGPQGTLITIQDDNTAKGWNLFKSFLKADIQDTNINKIHLVCFENPPSYYLDIDENLKVMNEVCPKEEKDKSCSNVNQNLNSLTTFRLGLDMKESERIARDNLVLPYLRSSNEKTKNQEEGKILYYAEAGDDEEEDPDDDLDI